jgi:hypothetical protein
LRCRVERGMAIIIGDIHIRARIDEETRDLE